MVKISCNEVCFECLESCINHHKLLDSLLQVGLRTVSLSAEAKQNYQLPTHNDVTSSLQHPQEDYLTMTGSI